MRKIFLCSLCHRGLLGGGLYLDRQSITFACQKLTVDSKYRNLVLPLQEIREVSWKRVVFPIAVFRLNSGEEYRFLIFNKRRFEKWFWEYRRQA